MRALPSNTLIILAEGSHCLLQITNLAIVFQDEHLVFLGDGLDGPLGLVGLFVVAVDHL